MFERKKIATGESPVMNLKNQIPANGYTAQRSVVGHSGVVAPLVQFKGVVKDYTTANGPFRALKGIDLDIYPGEFIAIVGKSGAGKTTLMNMLTGVDHLTEGEVWVDGTPVHALGENQLALWRGKKLGVIYQSFHLMPTLSLLHNVMLPMDFNGLFHPRKSVDRGMELLQQMELEQHASKLPAAISGGQQQRVAIARALANDPPIIVADEPTGRLDSVTAETIFRVFQSLIERGKTILMVTHDHSLAKRVSRTIHLADGQIAPEPTLSVLPRQGRMATFKRIFGS
jgi:putative ABC transport system ATP-binding protein